MKNTETVPEAGTGTEDFPFQVNTLTTKLESHSPHDTVNNEIWHTNKATPTRELQTGLSWNLALWIFTHNVRLVFKFLEKKAMSSNYQGVCCPSLVKEGHCHYFLLLLACLIFYASLDDQRLIVLMNGVFVLYNVCSVQYFNVAFFGWVRCMAYCLLHLLRNSNFPTTGKLCYWKEMYVVANFIVQGLCQG